MLAISLWQIHNQPCVPIHISEKMHCFNWLPLCGAIARLSPCLLQVAKIDIGYARTAKKIDMKRLKGHMWDVLSVPAEGEVGQGDQPQKHSDQVISSWEPGETERNTEEPSKLLGAGRRFASWVCEVSCARQPCGNSQKEQEMK